MLVRHRKGDILIDTGFGRNAEAQMSESPEAARVFGLEIASGANDRTSIVDALGTVGETSASLACIVITHGHYDNLGGAAELTAPIYVAPGESKRPAAQAAHCTVRLPRTIRNTAKVRSKK